MERVNIKQSVVISVVAEGPTFEGAFDDAETLLNECIADMEAAGCDQRGARIQVRVRKRGALRWAGVG